MARPHPHLYRLWDSFRMVRDLQTAHYRQKLARRHARQAGFCLTVILILSLLTLLR